MVKLYAYGEAMPPARQQLWHEITGFLKAGELLGNVTTEELQFIIDEEHLKAFGITREERQLKQKLAKTADEQEAIPAPYPRSTPTSPEGTPSIGYVLLMWAGGLNMGYLCSPFLAQASASKTCN